jgi:NAD(P)H-hydrate epimerase
MKRLLQLQEKIDPLSFLEKCRAYAQEKAVTLVLKGAPTFIFHPSMPTAVCSLGDPGMATAGTGDILTGMIASLLAQGKAPQEAAYLGVYLHAKAGELAAQELTSYCMIATDLLRYLPSAFKFLENKATYYSRFQSKTLHLSMPKLSGLDDFK